VHQSHHVVNHAIWSFFLVGVNMATWQQIKEGAKIFQGNIFGKNPPQSRHIWREKKEVDCTIFRPGVLHHSSL